MISTRPLPSHAALPRPSSLLSVLAVVLTGFIATGCGSSSAKVPPPLSGNTSVTVLLSSTGNDQLSDFTLDFATITLSNKAGKTVSLPVPQVSPDFMHLNGTVEPLLTVSVPQDVYTSAAVTIGNSWFNCVTIGPNGNLTLSYFIYQGVQTPVTVSLPAPITITGSSMGLTLDLQVSQSASFPSTCYTQGIEPFSITPTFNLTPTVVSAHPTNVENGKELSLAGQISSVNTSNNTLPLTLANGETLTVAANNNTVYQGINDFSLLTGGMIVDFDAAIQSDGSHLATRMAAYDPATQNVMTGPLLFVDEYAPCFESLGRQEMGTDYSPYKQNSGYWAFPSSTVFQISGGLTNLQALPFVASFTGANMVPGQNIAVFSQALAPPGGDPLCGYGWTDATTVTLLPQTINGTVTGVSSDGGFTTYTVALESYNLFPALAVQQAQATLLLDPSTVVVYTDSNTQLLNSQPLKAGSVLRFTGLVFNDNGTLRMDSSQIKDGVAVQPQSQPNATASGRRPKAGTVVHRYLQKPGRL
jgi:hypothetical protein